MKETPPFVVHLVCWTSSFLARFSSNRLGAFLKFWLAGAVIAICTLPARGAYTVQSKVERFPERVQYTCAVNNQDESWGLVMFAMDVPAETRMLTHAEPPAYKNPKRNAYWMMEVSREAQIDPHDGKAWLPKAADSQRYYRIIQVPIPTPP